MRGDPAPRPPGVADRHRFLHARAFVEREGNPDRLLNGEIARRPGIAMPKAEQQIDVRRPRSDAVQCRQCIVRVVGRCFRQRGKIEPAVMNLAGDEFQRSDLCDRQTEALQTVVARQADVMMLERVVIGRRHPRPDRRRRRCRELLAADRRGKSGEARRAAAQRRHSGGRENRLQPRVPRDKRSHRGFEIGLLSITWNRFWIVLFAVAVFFVLLYVMKRTAWGLQMRAVGANARAAAFAGVPVRRVTMWTALLSGALAGVAGVGGGAGRPS